MLGPEAVSRTRSTPLRTLSSALTSSDISRGRIENKRKSVHDDSEDGEDVDDNEARRKRTRPD